jgi:predicted transcriptional regulator
VGFKSPHEVLHNSLGALEREILSICWTHRDVNVRVACTHLNTPVAYTTVMTTMDRLFKKGLLNRNKVGRAFVYNPPSRAKSSKARLRLNSWRVCSATTTPEPLPMLSSLVDAVTECDRALLDELERWCAKAARARPREIEMTAAGWFALRGLTLALAWFCLLNMAQAWSWPCWPGRLRPTRDGEQHWLWFGLRVFASGTALASLPASSCRRTGSTNRAT